MTCSPEKIGQPRSELRKIARLIPGAVFIVHLLRQMAMALVALLHIARTISFKMIRRADYRRWNGESHLEAWWDQRTQEIAKLIPPGSRVVEFGAGRRQLEKMLPANCAYVPSDLVDRGPDTLVCDLNQRPLPNLLIIGSNVAVFGGVLEYLCDIEGLATWLASAGIVLCIASYDVMPAGMSWFGKIRERCRRAYYGYMSALTEAQLQAAFARAAFVVEKKVKWTSQRVYLFTRKGLAKS